jgi:hypothetical protein
LAVALTASERCSSPARDDEHALAAIFAFLAKNVQRGSHSLIATKSALVKLFASAPQAHCRFLTRISESWIAFQAHFKRYSSAFQAFMDRTSSVRLSLFSF